MNTWQMLESLTTSGPAKKEYIYAILDHHKPISVDVSVTTLKETSRKKRAPTRTKKRRATGLTRKLKPWKNKINTTYGSASDNSNELIVTSSPAGTSATGTKMSDHRHDQ